MAAPDWETIESAYRAGLMSLREIAVQHGISEGAIRKLAKRDDWSRDLVAKVKERADDLVRKAEVRKQVRTESAVSERVGSVQSGRALITEDGEAIEGEALEEVTIIGRVTYIAQEITNDNRPTI